MCDDYSTYGHANCDDSMLNVSPMKKSKPNVQIPTLVLLTPARNDIDEFLMHENLIATATKNVGEEKIYSESASIKVFPA